MDMILLGTRYIGMLSDLDIPDTSALNEALCAIASAGPHTRITLVPKPGRRSWGCAPATSLSIRRVPSTVAEAGDAAVLEHIRRRPGHRPPLEVNVSDRHIAVDTQHGLGDGRLFVDITSTLLAMSRGDTLPWVTNRDTRLALPRAIARTFGAKPTRLRTAWHELAALRAASTLALDASRRESEPWSPSFGVEVAHLGAAAESEVDGWRRANAPTCGSAAVWLCIVRRALDAAGLEMVHPVQVAFDCRRYLRKGQTANGNFATGIEIPVGVDEPLIAVGNRMRGVTTSALPLAMMGAVSTLTQLRPGLTVIEAASQFHPGAPARLMYSDLGRVVPFDRAPWRSDCARSFTGLLDPSGPDGVTVLNAVVGGERSISISFHDNVFDREVMKNATRYVEGDPIRFLERR